MVDCSVLITGGASGLGLGTAEVLLGGGFGRVVLVDRDGDGVKSVAEQLSGRYPSAVVVGQGCDVTSEADVQRAVEAACSEAGYPLRLVVNCAGVGFASRVLLRDGSMATSSFAKVLDINATGTFVVTKLAADAMRRRTPLAESGERGVVVNVASIAAYDGQIGQVPYAASKAAVVGMTLPLAREFARHQIRVVCIAPGVIDTPMMAAASQPVRDALVADIAFPSRLGRPAEFGALVAHLFHNTYINGETIRLDAGLRMPPQARL